MKSRGGNLSSRQWLLAAVVVVLIALPLWAQLSPGNWSVTASLNQARGGHAAAPLPNGQALIVGGTDASGHALASAEIYDAATDAFTLLSGGLTTATSGLSATPLNNGTVLVAGGTDDAGNAVATVQVFDPTTTAFANAPALSVARSHHSATLLSDGTVLIAGGSDGSSALGSIEIFNPTTRTIAPAPSQLAHPRQDHTATLLADGRVLIAGGSDASGPLATAEIYNPADGSVSPAGSLITARTMAAASRLIDDTVIVEGGQDANGAAIGSAEIYSPAANAFAAVANPMLTARASHLGVTLPNNGRVLIAGGMASGQPVGATEVYDPLTGTFIAMSQFDTARSGFGANTFALPMVGRLLASGGFDSTGTALSSTEMFSFPTIMTDQPDYPPGSQVTITGAGWSPNEPVSVVVHESDNDADTLLGESADASGAFTDTFQIQTNDGGVKFLMTATGATSGWTAQNKFTDAPSNQTYSPTSKALSASAGGATVSFTQTVTAPSGSGAYTDALQANTTCITGTLVPSAWISDSTCSSGGGSGCNLSFSGGDSQSWSVNFAVPAAATAGTYNVAVQAKPTTGGAAGVGAGTCVALTVSASSATKLAFSTSAFTGVVGQCNGPITVQTQNASNTPTNPASSLLVTLSTTAVSTGHFFSDASCSSGISTVTIPTSANSATFYYNDAAAGAPTLTASSSLTSPTQAETINVASTTTGVVSDNNPSVWGQQVTFTATVSATAPGAGTPTGTVQFKDGGSNLGSAVALSGGQAQLMTSALSVATHSITAVYSGDSNFNGSTFSSLSQVVNKADTTTTITSVTPSPAVVGSPSTVDFTVVAKSPGAGTPTGNVTVSDGTDSCSASVATGSCSITPTISGALTFTATYAGDNDFNTSFGTSSVTSNANTTTTVQSTANPSVFGQAITLTATVAASGGGSNPTCGTVEFSGSGAAGGTVSFSPNNIGLNGSSQAATTPTFSKVDSYSITATYTPGASCNYNGSSNSPAFMQNVNKGNTNVQVTLGSPSITLGQMVAVNYTVTAQSPATGTPTGTVSVSDGFAAAGDTCSASVATGTCTLTPSVSGLLTITATYAGDTNFDGNNGQANLPVNANTSTMLASSGSPSDFGVPVAFTATVSATGAAAPTCGSVTFSGPAGVHFASSTVTLDPSSQAQTAVTFDGAATYNNITATYSPAASSCYYNASPASSPISQVISPAHTSTTIGNVSPNPVVVNNAVTVGFTTANTSASSTAQIPTSDTVTITDGTDSGTCSITSPTGTTVTGSCSITPTVIGGLTLTVTYNGASADANFLMSSDTHGLTVNANTSTALSPSVNPSVFGQTVTLTATVTATGANNPTCGNVTFGAPAGAHLASTTVALNGNTAQTTVTFDAAGTYSNITASYAPTAGCFYNASNSGTGNPFSQTVNPANTSTSITMAPAATFGGTTTVSYTVLNTSNSATIPPTDTVVVSDNLGDQCSGTVGGASCVLTPSAAGSLTLTASYAGAETVSGDPNFHSSTSSSFPLTVYRAPTMLSVAPSSGTFGGSTNVSATLGSSAGAPCSVGKVLSFTLLANPIGSPSTDSGGTAGISNVSLSGISANGYPGGVAASFAGDSNCLPSNGSNTLTVNQAPTTTTVSVTPGTQQYSDLVTFQATITPDQIDNVAPATSVTFMVGTQTMGTANLASDSMGGLVATLSNVPLLETVAGQMAPGSHMVTAAFNGVNPNFSVNGATTTLMITQEDAAATYTGALYASTSSASSTTATLTLAATIQDAADGYPGDIRNAKVTFKNHDTNTALCSNVSVGLVNPADTTVGTATCQVTVNISCSSSPCWQTYTIETVVTGYYTDDNPSEDAVVDVSQPGSNFITGGGYLNITSSAGQVAGAAGTKNNFGFNVKYNKNLTNLQGNINTIVRSNVLPPMSCPQTPGIHVYQVKGNSMTSLAVQAQAGTATFNGKASIQDITNPASPCSVDGNATLQTQMTDKGTQGTDTIGITVWNKSGGVWFSSNWTGTTTAQQNLGGGNLSVH
jgi:hypothetical protein